MGDQKTSARGTFNAVLDTLKREATDRLLQEGEDLQPLAGHPNHAATIQGTAHLRDGSYYVPVDELADLYVAEGPSVQLPLRSYAGDRSVADELQLTADLTIDDLHRLRREFALANHPDRVAPPLRERATRRMTIANTLIDEALELLRTPEL
jgi:hypothetical protein